MSIPILIEKALLRMVDAFYEHRPLPGISVANIRQCKIISHRGEHLYSAVKENTLAAFDRAARSGVWGIEMDVRWTKDQIPVISHDADMGRLYGDACVIAQTHYGQLKKQFPDIATLETVVARFGKQQHLMIEIKAEKWIDTDRQDRTLSDILRPLEPGTDYHLLSLAPDILTPLKRTPPIAKVLIGYYLPDKYSHWIRSNPWAGLCGHYVTMRRAIVNRHQRHGQKIGTGFVNSPQVLFRELLRGTDWVFSDNAARLQGFLDTY